MAKIPVSAFIVAKNEEARLGRVIEALKDWVGEVVVVDSGSTDCTVTIAVSLGAAVYHNAWAGYGPQKSFAETKCRYDWLLNVDADEVVSEALAGEIQALFARGEPGPGAYRVRILNVYPGDATPRPFANDYNVVRFYHKAAGSYATHPVHDRVELREGSEPRQLRHPVYHHPYLSIEQLIDKNNRFSSFGARHTGKMRSSLPLKLRLFFEFPLNFLKFYIFRGHFMGGWKGFYFALCNAFMRTTRVAKMLEAMTADEAVAGGKPSPQPSHEGN